MPATLPRCLPYALLTAPVPQSTALLDAGGVALDPAVRAAFAGVAYDRCLAGMFAAPRPEALPAHGVALVDGGVSWLASNRAKRAVRGGRGGGALVADVEPRALGPVVVRDGGEAVVFAGDAVDPDGGRVGAAWRSGVAAAAG